MKRSWRCQGRAPKNARIQLDKRYQCGKSSRLFGATIGSSPFIMSKLVVASYCTTFLKSEMLHIYRQVSALREVQTFVMTKKKQNSERFPFDDIELIPVPRRNPFRHG